MNIQQFLAWHAAKPRLTYDQLRHDDPGLAHDPVSEAYDRSIMTFVSNTEDLSVLATSAGIRRE